MEKKNDPQSGPRKKRSIIERLNDWDERQVTAPFYRKFEFWAAIISCIISLAAIGLIFLARV